VTEATVAVEGNLDAAVMERLLKSVGFSMGRVYGRQGKSFLRKQLAAFNGAGNDQPWVVMVDLDHDAECPAAFRQEWLPSGSRFLCFRIVVREVEAWLLADRDGIARFLHVSPAIVPDDPEALPDPKQTLLGLARRSRSQNIKRDLLPRPGSHRNLGPGYDSRLTEFITNSWDIDAAVQQSKSLAGALRCLEQLAEKWGNWIRGTG